MTSLLLAFILLALSLVGVVLRKTYYALPLAELKRRAADHDHESARLYQAVAYGSSLRGLLWLYIAATSAAGVIVLARHLPLWLSLLLVMGVLWSAYSWLPASQPTRIGRRFTLLVTPFVAWVLNYFHPLLQRLTAIASRR
ncbi:MAG: hypothetical protein ABIV43_01665, partial [Candidatus Saccharimonadales bacterium]